MDRKTAVFYLIRHGQSTGNALGQVTGLPDDPLTEAGRGQVRALARMLEEDQVSWTRRYTSSLRRGVQTAEILLPSVPFEITAELAETDAGICKAWERTFFDLEYPDFFGAFNPDRPYPGGESHRDLYRRSVAWLQKALADAEDGSNILAVGHGGSINSILHYVLSVPLESFPKFQLANASLTVVWFRKKANAWMGTVERVGVRPARTGCGD